MEEKEDFLDFKIRPQITDLFRRFPSPAEVYYVGDAARKRSRFDMSEQ